MDELAQPGSFFVAGKEELEARAINLIVKRENDRVLLLTFPKLELVWVCFQVRVATDKLSMIQPIPMPEKGRRLLMDAVGEAYKDVVFEEVIKH